MAVFGPQAAHELSFVFRPGTTLQANPPRQRLTREQPTIERVRWLVATGKTPRWHSCLCSLCCCLCCCLARTNTCCHGGWYAGTLVPMLQSREYLVHTLRTGAHAVASRPPRMRAIYLLPPIIPHIGQKLCWSAPNQPTKHY